MTENHQPSVTADKFPRPQQEAIASEAARRAMVLGNAVGFAAQSLSPMLTNVLVAEATKYPVAPQQQSAPHVSELTSTPMPAQTWNALADAPLTPASNDAYLDAIADSSLARQTDHDQPNMNNDAAARAEEARRMMAEALGDQSNYDLAA